MKSRRFLAPIAVMLLVSVVRTVEANELQRLFFITSGNIGMAQANIEILGYDRATTLVTNQINAAIALLASIIDFPYPSPPFPVEQIVRCRTRLGNFAQFATGKNDRARAAYLNDVFNDFRTAMSLIFDSRHGLQARMNCDTKVADLGYHLGRGYTAVLNNDTAMASRSRGAVNLAVSEGIKASQSLACSFMFWDQWQSLGFQNARSADDWLRVIQGGITLVASTIGSASPPFAVPSSTGNSVSRGVLGRYKFSTVLKEPRMNHHPFAGATIEIRKCGGKYCGYLVELTGAQRQLGYRDGEQVYEFPALVRNGLREDADGWVMWRMSGRTVRGKLHFSYHSSQKWGTNIHVDERFNSLWGYNVAVKIN
jgi:hypothetical protein